MSRQIRDRDKYEHGSKWFCDWHREHGDGTTTMIDLDGAGYCHRCFETVYFVEATEQRRRKTAIVVEKLGLRAGIDVFVFYRDEANHPNHLLVDHRNAGRNYGWLTHDEAWNLLAATRRRHRCVITDLVAAPGG